MNTIRVALEPLTPIHIGSGEDIDPLAYAIEDGRFLRFDLDRLLGSLAPDERADLMQCIDLGEPSAVRKRLRDLAARHNAHLYGAAASQAVVEDYREGSEKPENQLRVNLAAREGWNYRPLLPGSSVKGAIRTAAVNAAVRTEHVNNPAVGPLDKPWSGAKLEGVVFRYRDVKADPFRCLKIPDTPFPMEAAELRRVYNVRRSRETKGIERNQFHLVAETLAPGEWSAAAEWLWDADLRAKPDSGINADIPHAFESLRQCCNAFYLKTLDEDIRRLYNDTPVLEALEAIRAEAGKPDRFLLRLGRFSGVFAVTLHEHRKPRAKRINGREVWGKTGFLTDNNLPLGWLRVRRPD